MVTSGDVVDWLAFQTPGPWIELLEEAVAEYELEVGEAEAPADHFVEWLAEWAREHRRRQRGLMLLTAHRAKGLEFDHVVVLDGGWDRISPGEDSDAPRRLHYVAMTRARRTLALARLPGPHPLQDALLDAPSVLHSTGPVDLQPAPVELTHRYRRLSLRDVFLSYAGYREPDHPVHAAIAALSPRDFLHVRADSNRWKLLDRHGTVVGELAGNFLGIAGMRCTWATVLGIATWDRQSSEPGYQDALRSDEWEVVVPELVFEPG